MADENDNNTPAKPKSKKRSISPARWAEIEHAWTHGKFAELQDMVDHFGDVTKAQLQERFKTKKLRRGQAIDEYNQKLQQELQRQAEEDAKLLAERIRETREFHYKTATNIAVLAWAELTAAKKNGLAMSTTKPNVVALGEAMKVMKIAREERYAVLGLDREQEDEDQNEGLPELMVHEMTAEQVDQVRAAREDPTEPVDEEEVVIASDIEHLDEDEPDFDDEEGA